MKSPNRFVRCSASIAISPSTPGGRGGKQGDEGGLKVYGAGPLQEFGRRAASQYPAAMHGDQPIEAGSLLHVGGGDNHAHALTGLSDFIDQVPELPARQWIDSSRRFVEDQDVRVVDERAAETELLFHSSRKVGNRAIREGTKAGAFQQRCNAAVALGTRMSKKAAEKIDIVEDRKRRIEVPAQPLRHECDAWVRAVAVGGAGHVAVEDFNVAFLDRPSAGNQRQQARFADPVGTDHSHHATGRNVERNGVERLRSAVGQADALQPRNVAQVFSPGAH